MHKAIQMNYLHALTLPYVSIILCTNGGKDNIFHNMNKAIHYSSNVRNQLFIVNHGQDYWNNIERILRYIKKTLSAKLCYKGLTLLLEDMLIQILQVISTKENSLQAYFFTLASGYVS